MDVGAESFKWNDQRKTMSSLLSESWHLIEVPRNQEPVFGHNSKYLLVVLFWNTLESKNPCFV